MILVIVKEIVFFSSRTFISTVSLLSPSLFKEVTVFVFLAYMRAQKKTEML